MTHRPDRTISRRAALAGLGAGGLGLILPAGFGLASTPTADQTGYPLVEIVARDFSFAMPAEIPGGLTRFMLRNQGAFAHHVIFLHLRDGVTQAEIDAAAEEPDYLPLFALGEPLGGPNAAPSGGSSTAIVDLPAGEYQVICVIGDDAGVPHYHHGMIAPLTVTTMPEAQPPPAADLTITLRDHTFHGLPAELPAGEHVWAITNAGPEIHELVVFRQSPGVSFEMVANIFGLVPEATPAASATPPPGPPFVDVGGVTPMGAGITNWAVLDLAPGDYFAICFVLSPTREKAPALRARHDPATHRHLTHHDALHMIAPPCP